VCGVGRLVGLLVGWLVWLVNQVQGLCSTESCVCIFLIFSYI
jgi:hypothetical protein